MAITVDYSGVVIDQNAAPSSSYTPSGTVFQQFLLPVDYARGTSLGEVVYPDLSGFQVLLAVPSGGASAVSIAWQLGQYVSGSGWTTLASGTTTGCHADGPMVWADVVFPAGVPVGASMVPTRAGTTQTSDLLRVGVSCSGVDHLWVVSPNPLGSTPNVKALVADGVTPLLVSGHEASLGFRILALVADSGVDQLGNPYRSALSVMSASSTSTTSGRQTGYYLSPPQPSAFAVVANYFDLRDVGGSPVVVDSVLVDPITPNATVNLYYSNDPVGPGTDEPSWEGLLWTYSTTVQASRRTTFALPAPITASYVKVEYTGLQAQPYDPGQFQRPTTYKKFPKWVADFFILQLEQPAFVAGRVDVVYDALTFAYSYLLDDLSQSPRLPQAAPDSTLQQVESFFNAPDATSQVDPLTLGKIDLVLSTYQRPPGALGDASTIAGANARTVALSTTNYPVEGGPTLPSVDFSDVSSLDRDPLVFEQGFPAMYFYLTCRHAYRQLTATFQYDRAYFVGINEIAFLRNDYTVATDATLYIESGTDLLNSEVNDFVVTDGVWTVPSYTGPRVLT